jgi:peptidoglycan hydrolase CwlO-like protein
MFKIMDYENSYDFGDIANVVTNQRNLNALQQQTATLRSQLQQQQNLQQDLSRKTDKLIEMQRQQMEYDKKMAELRAEQENMTKQLRKELLRIDQALEDCRSQYLLS